MKYFKYLVLGTLFGIILTKSEVISWFRIQEMFRFQAFHMYGIIGSAIVVGMISIQFIKRNRLKSIDGEPIVIATNLVSPIGHKIGPTKAAPSSGMNSQACTWSV